MSDIRERVARAILETDPTCDYDACKERQAAGGAWAELNANWWESLHEQADNALSACGYFEMRRALNSLEQRVRFVCANNQECRIENVQAELDDARSALSKAGGT